MKKRRGVTTSMNERKLRNNEGKASHKGKIISEGPRKGTSGKRGELRSIYIGQEKEAAKMKRGGKLCPIRNQALAPEKVV